MLTLFTIGLLVAWSHKKAPRVREFRFAALVGLGTKARLLLEILLTLSTSLVAIGWPVVLLGIGGRLGTRGPAPSASQFEAHLWLWGGWVGALALLNLVGVTVRYLGSAWFIWCAIGMTVLVATSRAQVFGGDAALLLVPHNLASLLVFWSAARWRRMGDETVAGVVGIPVGALLVFGVQWATLFLE